jgi:hypothetical protein
MPKNLSDIDKTIQQRMAEYQGKKSGKETYKKMHMHAQTSAFFHSNSG